MQQWPMAKVEAKRQDTMHVMRDGDVLWRLEGDRQQVLVGILASTEHITVGVTHLMPSQHTEAQTHAGDESLYLLEGTLNVRLPENDGGRWFELKPGDGFYMPEGVPHQYYNMTGHPARFIFGVAPSYFPAVK